MDAAANCKFHCVSPFFFPVEWVKKAKNKKFFRKQICYHVLWNEEPWRSSLPPGVGVSMKVVLNARRPRILNLHAPNVEDPYCLREQIPSETIYSKRPSQLPFKLYYLDLYLERVTSSSCYCLYGVVDNIGYLSSRRIQALINTC